MALANRDLNQVTWEQLVMAGDLKFKTSQVVPAFGFAPYAGLLGLEALISDMRMPPNTRSPYENKHHHPRLPQS